MNNTIFNCDNKYQLNYIKYLKKNYIIDKPITREIKTLIKNIFSPDAINYKTNYIKNVFNIFSKIFDKSIDFIMYKLDHRDYDITNNESVLYMDILCFKFVIKVISDSKNGNQCSEYEKNNSIFITNNFIVNNCCPHFAYMINSIKIGKQLQSYTFNTPDNIGLIYDFINPWILKINHNPIKINNLSDLLQELFKYKHMLSPTYIDDVLYNIIFQIIYSLCAMSKYRINHNDFRSSNILIHGNYQNHNTYDLYHIINKKIELKYYVPNMGFKIKIIDFGLLNSDKIKELNNPNSTSHKYRYDAGIFAHYSEYYDIHTIINDIMFKDKIKELSPNIYNLLIKIVNQKYIGIYNKNPYLNEYWRLGFPFMIEEFIKIYNLSDVNFKYDNSDTLVIDDYLIDYMITYIHTLSDEKSSDKQSSEPMLRMIKDPLNNNTQNILKPYDAINLFTNYMLKIDQNLITDEYLLNFDD